MEAGMSGFYSACLRMWVQAKIQGFIAKAVSNYLLRSNVVFLYVSREKNIKTTSV
jgi:hypothetical protein